MKVETKYNVGDEVYFIECDTLTKDTIKGINILLGGPYSLSDPNSVEVEYIFDFYTKKKEDFVYASKEEFISKL